jgi:hypothetical protein
MKDREKGLGSPTGELPSKKTDQLRERRSSRKENRANNPSGALNSIRADEDVETFVADLRQNKEQLLSFSRNLMAGKIRPSKTEEEAKDNIALGLYIDLALRVVSNPNSSNTSFLFSNNPDDWPDENSGKALTEPERREILADWASTRIASKWLASHPNSVPAKTLAQWGAYAFHDIHPELLQEMWSAILDSKKS